MADRRQDRPPITDRLRAAIGASGVSYNELARLAGVGQPQISRFMTGERDLTLAIASRLCAALGLDLVPAGRVADEPLTAGELTTRERRAEGAAAPASVEVRGRGRRVDLERAATLGEGGGEQAAAPGRRKSVRAKAAGGAGGARRKKKG
jgi:transcriptional regulator with XRE-family HTH domain